MSSIRAVCKKYNMSEEQTQEFVDAAIADAANMSQRSEGTNGTNGTNGSRCSGFTTKGKQCQTSCKPGTTYCKRHEKQDTQSVASTNSRPMCCARTTKNKPCSFPASLPGTLCARHKKLGGVAASEEEAEPISEVSSKSKKVDLEPKAVSKKTRVKKVANKAKKIKEEPNEEEEIKEGSVGDEFEEGKDFAVAGGAKKFDKPKSVPSDYDSDIDGEDTEDDHEETERIANNMTHEEYRKAKEIQIKLEEEAEAKGGDALENFRSEFAFDSSKTLAKPPKKQKETSRMASLRKSAQKETKHNEKMYAEMLKNKEEDE